ncbi:site-specific DNA recombinase [uncultured Gammaproteobacteria bacterium]
MSIAPQKKVRCAVYCRKSSEEGLEQDFNSLDAQRDAGLSYIQSQKQEGWIAVGDRYEDGGFSGGNMERPALKRLLADIERGLVDCVVVYKVDRLTRALTDFAKLVELFDKHTVTFVSVTQSFNTTTSMGRLTLNVLLSFAQYERELAGERIRDKFAASRKRGLWMGGIPPLGYDVVSRKLVVNPPEAELVQLIFRRFLELGSATRLVEELAAAGHRTKSWTTQDGKERQGQRIDKGFVYKLLNNRLYLGEAVHKGVSHPGEHEAIIDGATWQRVQIILSENAHSRGNATRAETPAPLKGLLRCAACGSAMTPTHTRRRGRLYRYYTCTSAIKQGHATCPVRSLAAGEAETLVLSQLRQVFCAPEIAARTLAAANDSTVGEREIVDALASLDAIWESLFPAEQQRLLHLLVEQVAVTPEGFEVHLRAAGLRSVAAELQGPGEAA